MNTSKCHTKKKHFFFFVSTFEFVVRIFKIKNSSYAAVERPSSISC